MATANKFEDFTNRLCIGKVHDLNADTLEIYYTNATPSASADTVKADLAEITNENGYTAPEDTTNTASEASGTLSVVCVDVTTTASGGSFGPFRYVVWFNTTPASPLDPLIIWWDFSSALTVNDGESFTTDFGASTATLA
ncbi:MAG: hypothetical protein ACR2RF_25050 [Geminicoccaceae bacterium]